MSLVQSLRQIDFVSALRTRDAVRARFLARGFEIGQEKGDSEVEAPFSGARLIIRANAERARAAIETGDDDLALSLLDSICEQAPCSSMIEALRSVGNRKIAFHWFEKSLPSLVGDPVRIERYLLWLAAVAPIEFREALFAESKSQTFIRNENWVLKSYQTRTMEAWIKIYDLTDGFTGPAATISAHMTSLADEAGQSRLFVHIFFPVNGQALDTFRKLEDKRIAVRGLLETMLVHAETGTWPDGVTDSVKITCGDQSAELSLRTEPN